MILLCKWDVLLYKLKKITGDMYCENPLILPKNTLAGRMNALITFS